MDALHRQRSLLPRLDLPLVRLQRPDLAVRHDHARQGRHRHRRGPRQHPHHGLPQRNHHTQPPLSPRHVDVPLHRHRRLSHLHPRVLPPGWKSTWRFEHGIKLLLSGQLAYELLGDAVPSHRVRRAHILLHARVPHVARREEQDRSGGEEPVEDPLHGHHLPGVEARDRRVGGEQDQEQGWPRGGFFRQASPEDGQVLHEADVLQAVPDHGRVLLLPTSLGDVRDHLLRGGHRQGSWRAD